MTKVATTETRIAIYEVRNVFGEDKAYPVNDIAEAFCDLTNTKTLLSRHKSVIESLGYTVKFVSPSIENFNC